MDITIILVVSGSLLTLAFFIGYELKKIQNLVDSREKYRLKLEKANRYNKNMRSLLELQAEKGIAAAITSRIKGNIVIFGYGEVGKFLIAELKRNSRGVAIVIENNQQVQEQVNSQRIGLQLISSNQVNQFLKSGDEILISIFHDAAYTLKQELSEIVAPEIKIHLLEDLLR